MFLNSYLKKIIILRDQWLEKQKCQYCSVASGGTCFFINYFIMGDLKGWISAPIPLNTSLTQSVHLPLAGLQHVITRSMAANSPVAMEAPKREKLC